MLSSTVAIQPALTDSGINVGLYLERLLALRREAQQKIFRSFNPETDNFPFLLERSGLRDAGGYLARWTDKTDFNRRKGYSDQSEYQMRGVAGLKPVSTRVVMGQLNLRHKQHTTTRELIGLFVAHPDEMKRFLTRKHRLVALGADMFHPFGAALIVFKRNRFVLREIPHIGEVLWDPSDIFITRL